MKFSIDFAAIRQQIDEHPAAAGHIYNTFTNHWRTFIDDVDEENLHKDSPVALEIMEFASAAAELHKVFEAANQTQAANALQEFRSTIVHKYNALPTTH